MAYRIEVTPAAKRDFQALPRRMMRRVDAAIMVLRDNPRPPRVEFLKGPLRGYYRIRVGDFRIIYQVLDDRLLVCVLRIRDRKEAYR